MLFYVLFRDPSPGRNPNPPIECSPRPQAIRRQSSTTEEILIARGFRRQSTTEEMIRCRNFRRQSSQSDDVCQRFVYFEAKSSSLIGLGIDEFSMIKKNFCFFSGIEVEEVRLHA